MTGSQTSVAIIGAGDIGGATAQALAARDRVSRILIVDTTGSVAAGKALDIMQSGAVDGFHTRLEGTTDISRIAGCDVCIVADRVGPGSPEWQGEEGLALLTRLAANLADAPLVFAGTSQADLLAAAAREARVARNRLIGSVTEALASAVKGIVAMEGRCSPREVMLTVLGRPPAPARGAGAGFVVPWSEASIGGYALERVLEQVQLTRMEARLPRLWPPGAYTLGLAAARVTEAILESSRATFAVMTLLDGEFGLSGRVATVPALLSNSGIVHTRVPTLNTRERVLLGTALGSAFRRTLQTLSV